MAKFKISSLVDGVRYIDEASGHEFLPTRLPVPIPANHPAFTTTELARPLRLNQVSIQLYGEPSVWALLAEWNGLANPAQWLVKRLPRGFPVRYMDLDTYKAIATRKRRTSFRVSGITSLDVDIPRLTPTAATSLDLSLTAVLDALQGGDYTYRLYVYE